MSSRQLDSIIESTQAAGMDPSLTLGASYTASESLASSTRSVVEDGLEEARQRLLMHQDDQDSDDDKDQGPAVVGRGLPFIPEAPPTVLTQTTRYGSVSTLQSNQQRKVVRGKRYRLAFLILLAFDLGLIVFLSIICTQVHERATPSVLVLWSIVHKIAYISLCNQAP